MREGVRARRSLESSHGSAHGIATIKFEPSQVGPDLCDGGRGEIGAGLFGEERRQLYSLRKLNGLKLW
jgi:hypothetical protein